jgi:hypothetical protein
MMDKEQKLSNLLSHIAMVNQRSASHSGCFILKRTTVVNKEEGERVIKLF